MADPIEYAEDTAMVRLSFRRPGKPEEAISVVTQVYAIPEGASSISQLDMFEMAVESLTRRLAEELHLHRYAAQAERELSIHDELRGS